MSMIIITLMVLTQVELTDYEDLLLRQHVITLRKRGKNSTLVAMVRALGEMYPHIKEE